ncbi:MAG: aldo/keto reductase [Bacillota bacterium]
MQYRDFGRHGFKVSALGFGTMRLPVIDGDNRKVDEDEAIKMIRYAIDHGVNYLDTAYPYHGGHSENVLGKALKDGYRERIKVATKLPVWLLKTQEDFEKYLSEQMERLKLQHIDLYLLHALDRNLWKTVEELDLLECLENAKREGRVGLTGFSFHDNLDLFKQIVDSYPWDFCQIQLNYVDDTFQAGVEGLKYAAAQGIPVVIMEPIKGGRLAENQPEEVGQILDRAAVRRTPAEWALRWVLNHSEVTVALSGMSTMQQVAENINTVLDAYPGSLTGEELSLLSEAKQAFLQRVKVGCTRCNYCVPCAQGVLIPDIFYLYNDIYVYGRGEAASRIYARFVAANKSASACVECGECEQKCPQGLKIMDLLKDAHSSLQRAS